MGNTQILQKISMSVEGGFYVLFLCVVKSQDCGWEAGDQQQDSVTPGLAGQ